jgi:hypothetical protein
MGWALTHVALINAARNLSGTAGGPAEERSHADPPPVQEPLDPATRHRMVS